MSRWPPGRGTASIQAAAVWRHPRLPATEAGHPRDLRAAAGKHHAGTSSCRSMPGCRAHEQGRVYPYPGPKIVCGHERRRNVAHIPASSATSSITASPDPHYQPGTGIHSLPISPISQARRRQRKGAVRPRPGGTVLTSLFAEDLEARRGSRRPRSCAPPAEVILRMIYCALANRAPSRLVEGRTRKYQGRYETLQELGPSWAAAGTPSWTPSARGWPPSRSTPDLRDAHRGPTARAARRRWPSSPRP